MVLYVITSFDVNFILIMSAFGDGKCFHFYVRVLLLYFLAALPFLQLLDFGRCGCLWIVTKSFSFNCKMMLTVGMEIFSTNFVR